MFDWKKWNGEDVPEISFVCVVLNIDNSKQFAIIPQAVCYNGSWDAVKEGAKIGQPFICINVVPKYEQGNGAFLQLYKKERGDEIFYCQPAMEIPATDKKVAVRFLCDARKTIPNFIAYEDEIGFSFRYGITEEKQQAYDQSGAF